MVSGAEIPIVDDIDLCCDFSSKNNVQGNQHVFVDAEINKLLKMGVIEISNHEKGEVISPIFLVPKSDGSFRLILNLKEFNKSVQYEHFKMENLSSAVAMMEKHCWMASVDLKHAYYSVPIKKSFRKFLKFMWRQKLYNFTCFPNGLSNCPRYFTKLMKPAYAYLRSQGFLSTYFIDDCYLQGQSYQHCLQNVQETVKLFKSLGFVVHQEKSVLTPCKKIKYLGFWLDSDNMIISLTEDKKVSIVNACSELLSKSSMTIRELAKVIGMLVAAFPAVLWGPLHFRELEAVKIKALKKSKGEFEALTVLTQSAKDELMWWTQNISNSHYPLEINDPDIEMHTDASQEGYGAVCGSNQAGGRWTIIEKDKHINVLELMAIENGLKCFENQILNKHVKILCDNVCAVTYVKKMGGSHSPECNAVANRIWSWCQLRNIWLTITFLPGILNIQADKKSRLFDDSTEWKLNPVLFQSVKNHYQITPDIDLFASRLNYQLKPFVSWGPDPEAYAVDAFSLSWISMSVIYAFPPFSVLPRVFAKILRDQAEGILIVPNWPTASWYPQMLRLLIKNPMILPRGKNLLQLSHSDTPHPLYKKLQLLAVMCSGKPYRHKEYLEKLVTSCVPHGDHQHKDSMLHTLRGGKFSVLDRKLIPFEHL